ncbi:hypothetical protein MAHJHV51_57030 [Mycobacterium avium subsp. hominissuis]
MSGPLNLISSRIRAGVAVKLPPPLPFAQTEAKTGASVVVLGYPGGGGRLGTARIAMSTDGS